MEMKNILYQRVIRERKLAGTCADVLRVTQEVNGIGVFLIYEDTVYMAHWFKTDRNAAIEWAVKTPAEDIVKRALECMAGDDFVMSQDPQDA